MTGKNVLVYDFGIGLEHGLALARAGNKVKYYTPWGAGFPSFKNFAVGLGFDKMGLEKALFFFDHVDWADMFFFPDVGAGDIANYLRNTTGKPVFGPAKAEKIENNRIYMRQEQHKIGLPTQPTVVITGVPALREYLKNHNNKFVKIDIFREDAESFPADSYAKTELSLDELETDLGPFNEKFRFVIEDQIEGIEPGFDLFFTGEHFLKPYLWGIEYHKKGYIGRFVEEMPKPLQDVADKMEPFLASLGYRGALSTEFRMKGGKPYLIDTCARFAYPLSSAYGEVIKNYSDVIWSVASGQEIRIEPTAEYFAIAPLYDEHARKAYVRLDYNPKFERHVKLRGAARVDNVTYAVPPGDIVFILAAWSNSYQTCLRQIDALAKEVDSKELITDSIDTLKKIVEIFKKFPENGLGEF